jgi:hypothetical protein
MDSYQVGTNPNKVTLRVNTGTAATCHTAIFKKDPSGTKTRIADSTAADNGSIGLTTLGLADSVAGNEIIIQSLADFGALPDSVIADIAANVNALLKFLDITYTFDGGTNGAQSFKYTTDDCVVSTNGKLASVVKHAVLIP